MPTKKINPADFEEKEKVVEVEEEEDVTPKKITSDEGSDTDDAYFDAEEDDVLADSEVEKEESW